MTLLKVAALVCGTALLEPLKETVYEKIDVTVEYRIGIGRAHTGTEILYHLIRLKEVRTYLASEIIILDLTTDIGRFIKILLLLENEEL